MARSPFTARSPFPVLARIPLLPAADSRETVPGADALLAEGMFLASRHVDAEADLTGRDRSRMAITRRGYEIRAHLRPVPHMVFAGVALARFTGQGEIPSLRLGTVPALARALSAESCSQHSPPDTTPPSPDSSPPCGRSPR